MIISQKMKPPNNLLLLTNPRAIDDYSKMKNSSEVNQREPLVRDHLLVDILWKLHSNKKLNWSDTKRFEGTKRPYTCRYCNTKFKRKDNFAMIFLIVLWRIFGILK